MKIEEWVTLTLVEPRSSVVVRRSCIEAFYEQEGYGIVETSAGTYRVNEDLSELCEILQLGDLEVHGTVEH